MLEEARHNENFLDGFYIKEFRRLPDGLIWEDLLPEQKEYILYLMASVPSVENVSSWLVYKKEYDEIMAKDYSAEVSIDRNVAEGIAKRKGLTVNQFIREQSEKFKVDDLDALHEKHPGFEQDVREIRLRTRVEKRKMRGIDLLNKVN